MGIPANQVHARKIARRVLSECGIDQLPVRPADVARSKSGLLFETDVDLNGKAYGAFLYRQNHFIILVSGDCPTEGHKRFSFAHELGHYHLPQHLEIILSDGDMHLTGMGGSNQSRLEDEADCFASEILMPRWGVEKIVTQEKPGLRVCLTKK